MTLNHLSITTDKDEEIMIEKMTCNLFIQIDNSNLNIIQDNEPINRLILHYSSLVLANRITRIIPNKIQANCRIKGGPLVKIIC